MPMRGVAGDGIARFVLLLPVGILLIVFGLPVLQFVLVGCSAFSDGWANSSLDGFCTT
jgi:hypothetical protein